MVRKKFKEALILKSDSDLYEEAIKEWSYNNIIKNGEVPYCICGAKIKQNVNLINKNNGNQITVGVDCMELFLDNIVNKFDISTTILVTNYFKVKKNIWSNFCNIILKKALELNIINIYEHNNYTEYCTNQKEWNVKRAVNTKILNWIEDKKDDFDKENYIFQFGKYKGQSYKDIKNLDESYIKWFDENVNLITV